MADYFALVLALTDHVRTPALEARDKKRAADLKAHPPKVKQEKIHTAEQKKAVLDQIKRAVKASQDKPDWSGIL